MMQESSPPPGGWLCPFFGDIVETIRSHVQVDRSSKLPGPDAAVYTVEEGFMPNDHFWINFIRAECMDREANVLYRPQIVDNLVQRVERLYERRLIEGLMVKGPQGVGKSYSLVNLSRYLLATGKYIVTIIPDCNRWTRAELFFTFLLQSVGVKPSSFGLMYDEKIDKYFEGLISDIDYVLSQNGMRWVFVFDQVNAIFARKDFNNKKDVTKLPFPFSMIHEVIKPGRIISIISASANNHLSYRENHPGFHGFNHPIQLEEREIKILYSPETVLKWNWEELEYATGRVPWYLQQWATDPLHYTGIVRKEIEESLDKLKEEQNNKWTSFVSSAIRCLLRLWDEKPPDHFDRKYSLVYEELKDDEKKIIYTIQTLFPLVEIEYRDYFWGDMMRYISDQKLQLLNVCRNESTSNDMRGRLFEMTVFARLSSKGLSNDDFKKIFRDAGVPWNKGKAAIEGGFTTQRLDGQSYPKLDLVQNETVFIFPIAPNFPAVDVIVCVGNVVIALQLHTSESHSDVLSSLQDCVEKAQWGKDGIQNIILIYLSPHALTTSNFKKKLASQASTVSSNNSRIGRSKRSRRSSTTTSTIEYVTLCYSILDFENFGDV